MRASSSSLFSFIQCTLRRGAPRRITVIDAACRESLAESGAGTKKAAFDGPDRQFQNLTDLLVVAIFHITQNENCPEIRFQPAERLHHALMLDMNFRLPRRIEFRSLHELPPQPRRLLIHIIIRPPSLLPINARSFAVLLGTTMT